MKIKLTRDDIGRFSSIVKRTIGLHPTPAKIRYLLRTLTHFARYIPYDDSSVRVYTQPVQHLGTSSESKNHNPDDERSQKEHGHAYSPKEIPGSLHVKGLWFYPNTISGKFHILYIHGGAFVFGSPKEYKAMLAPLSRETCCPIFAVDYRLSPENKFPCAVNDCYHAYLYLLELGIDCKEIVIAGDSAGGNLVFATMLKILKENNPKVGMPGAAIAISPWLDLPGQSCPSRKKNAACDPLIPIKHAQLVADFYAPRDLQFDPLISPLYASKEALVQLPPTYLEVGSTEVLLDDSKYMYVNMVQAQTDAGIVPQHELYLTDDEPHVYHIHGDAYDMAVKSFIRMAEFLNRIVPSPPAHSPSSVAQPEVFANTENP